jgi:hypothetical protein
VLQQAHGSPDHANCLASQAGREAWEATNSIAMESRAPLAAKSCSIVPRVRSFGNSEEKVRVSTGVMHGLTVLPGTNLHAGFALCGRLGGFYLREGIAYQDGGPSLVLIGWGMAAGPCASRRDDGRPSTWSNCQERQEGKQRAFCAWQTLSSVQSRPLESPIPAPLSAGSGSAVATTIGRRAALTVVHRRGEFCPNAVKKWQFNKL